MMPTQQVCLKSRLQVQGATMDGCRWPQKPFILVTTLHIADWWTPMARMLRPGWMRISLTRCVASPSQRQNRLVPLLLAQQAQSKRSLRRSGNSISISISSGSGCRNISPLPKQSRAGIKDVVGHQWSCLWPRLHSRQPLPMQLQLGTGPDPRQPKAGNAVVSLRSSTSWSHK